MYDYRKNRSHGTKELVCETEACAHMDMGTCNIQGFKEDTCYAQGEKEREREGRRLRLGVEKEG